MWTGTRWSMPWGGATAWIPRCVWRGLMLALELVADRDTRSPVDKATPARVQAAAYRTGAMVRVSGVNIILSPPLVLTSGDVQASLSALEAGFVGL